MENHAARILLHCAKKRRNVWTQLLVLGYLSNKGPVGVCVYEWEKTELVFPICAPLR